ncbi:MAG: phospholipase D-like domain-containing protein [Akkermansiaceae bacterium]
MKTNLLIFLLGLHLPNLGRADGVRDFQISLENDPVGHRVVTWASIPGRTYVVEESDTLSLWTPIEGTELIAEQDVSHQAIPDSSPVRFLRVIESRPGPDWQEAFFNLPNADGTRPDLTLENKLRELIGMAAPGSTLRACVYTWDREEMIAPFVEALERGVDVRIIVGVNNDPVPALSAALPGRVTVCTNSAGDPDGCHGGRINHNKFFIFSDLIDGNSNCVLQSSANLTDLQLINANNLVIFRNNEDLYKAYFDYWNAMSGDVDDLNFYQKIVTPDNNEAHYFPRSSANGTTGELDPVVEILRDVKPLEGGSIRVAMAFWTAPRRGIVDWLAAFERTGMDVQVIVDKEDTSSTIQNALAAGGIPLVTFSQLHSKYMLIDAMWRGKRQKIVLTGSHNYTGPALNGNDETMLVITNPLIYDAFLNNWNALHNHPLAVE